MEKRTPFNNPYRPGAGQLPLFLAGREKLRAGFAVLLEQAARKRPGQSILLIGLRGVGKTALLLDFEQTARAKNAFVVRIEVGAAGGANFLRDLSHRLQQALQETESRHKKVLRALGSVASFLKVNYRGLEINVKPLPGIADSGALESDLSEMLVAAGEAVAVRGKTLLLAVDELQYAEKNHLAALLGGMHRCAQENAPVVLTAAGLPQLRAAIGKASSYAERMFVVETIGALNPDDARDALAIPAEKKGVRFSSRAMKAIYGESQGYPYFLQEWGYHCWLAGRGACIGEGEVKKASEEARAKLDESFFRMRMGRMTPKETTYLAAMADLQSESVLSAKIAERLGVKPESVSPRRDKLIERGMIYAPERGKLAFTSPLFGDFLRRHFSSRNGKF